MIARRRVSPPLGLAALLLALSIAVFWPGYVEYDSVLQYVQALSGRYDDWHPPIMAHLWSLTAAARIGAGPMLAIQMAAYWLGLGLIADTLWRNGRRSAAIAVLVAGLWPPFLGWQAAVLKDMQMVGAMLLGTGLVARGRIADRPIRWPTWAIATIVFGYAVLVRANAVFAAAPLIAMLTPVRGGWRKGAIAVALVVATVMLSPIVNHRLLGARASGVERTLPLYDLSGIAVRSGADDTGFRDDEVALLRARDCVRPYFWDPLGEASRCGGATERLRQSTSGQLYARWIAAVLHHPLAYAGHRAAHLNSTWRWWVPAAWPDAQPPQGSEPNGLGLGQPAGPALRWQQLAGVLTLTPAGWPIVAIILAIVGMAATRGLGDGTVAAARALFVSALALEASFAVISIASDLRYHLWSMIATALGWVLAAGHGRRDRRVDAKIVALAIVVAVGLVARMTLPAPPQTYEGMLG